MVLPKTAENSQAPKRLRFGMRWLLALVLVFSIALAWFSGESRRVRREMRLTGELAQLEVRVRGREPTGLDLAAHKLLGEKDDWLRERLDDAWFSRPTVLVTWTATDEQAPQIAQRVRQLGAVRELHLEASPISEAGIARFKSQLPDVVVWTRADLAANRSLLQREHFAAGALRSLAFVTSAILAMLLVLCWPLLNRQRRKRFQNSARRDGN